jgi:hypothetical protein
MVTFVAVVWQYECIWKLYTLRKETLGIVERAHICSHYFKPEKPLKVLANLKNL